MPNPGLSNFFNTQPNRDIVKELEEETLRRLAILTKVPAIFQAPEELEEAEEEEEE